MESILAALPAATSKSTFFRQHRPKDLSIFQRDLHHIEIKYCEDTRPQNRQSAVQHQHEGLCLSSKESWVLTLKGLAKTCFMYILSTTSVLLSTLIRSRFQVKPAILLITIDLVLVLFGGEILRYPVPKWLLFLN
jgi:hypothetical protein